MEEIFQKFLTLSKLKVILVFFSEREKESRQQKWRRKLHGVTNDNEAKIPPLKKVTSFCLFWERVVVAVKERNSLVWCISRGFLLPGCLVIDGKHNICRMESEFREFFYFQLLPI